MFHPSARPAASTDTSSVAVGTASTSDWREALPVLTAGGVTLRELRLSDAPTLLALLTTEEVARFIPPPPSSVGGFERFILWAQRERAAGRCARFGIVPDGSDAAVGIFQVRTLAPGSTAAEWGFALGSNFWGGGIFVSGARLVADFAFGQMGVYRLEARAAVENGRANGALRKIGANAEGVLGKSFLHNEAYLDQVLWTITANDWRMAERPPPASRMH
jgi:RimJ/RimL family protein N-acetyltransferase